MGSPIVSVRVSRKPIEENTLWPDEDHAEFVETPFRRNRTARGMVAGVLLGAGLWGAILVLTGIVKL